MTARDLLQDIFDKRISGDDAEQALAASLDSTGGAHTARIFGFRTTEWTAYSHGAELSEISRWRHTGWPDTCVICHRPIVVEDFGWQLLMSTMFHARVTSDVRIDRASHLRAMLRSG